MSLSSLRENLLPKRNFQKYEFDGGGEKLSKIKRIKKTCMERIRGRPHKENVTLEGAVSLRSSQQHFSDTRVKRRRSDPDWRKSQQKIVFNLKKQLSEKTDEIARLNEYNASLQWTVSEQQTVICNQKIKLDENEEEKKQLVNHLDEQISTSQRKLEEYQGEINALRSQKTTLEKDMDDIRQKSKEILTINVNNCKGVAIGGDNADFTMSVTEEGNEISKEVKKTLDTISLTCRHMNSKLQKQTEIIDKIDKTTMGIATEKPVNDHKMAHMVNKIQNLIHKDAPEESDSMDDGDTEDSHNKLVPCGNDEEGTPSGMSCKQDAVEGTTVGILPEIEQPSMVDEIQSLIPKNDQEQDAPVSDGCVELCDELSSSGNKDEATPSSENIEEENAEDDNRLLQRMFPMVAEIYRWMQRQ